MGYGAWNQLFGSGSSEQSSKPFKQLDTQYTKNTPTGEGLRKHVPHIQQQDSYKQFGKSSKYRAPEGGYGHINRIGELNEEKYAQIREGNQKLDQADSDYMQGKRDTGKAYMDRMGATTGQYKGQIQELMDGAKSESEMAHKTYTGTTQPKLVNMLEKDMAEAYGTNGVGGAMSLQEAGDPNNKVASSVRNMFNEEGANARNAYNAEGLAQQDIFNRQGSNAQNQGLAASGVLGSLGAQNAATAFGAGGPMSVGQQQALFAASQGQAGQAFARAQQQMSDLRQQGLVANTGLRSRGLDQSQGLRTQGLGAGMQASSDQYGRGERARDRAKGAVTQMNDEQDRYLGNQANLRGERGRGSADMMGIDMGMAQADKDINDEVFGIGHSNTYKKGARDMAGLNEFYGNSVGVEQGKQGIKNANQAGALSQGTGAASTVASMFGYGGGGGGGQAATQQQPMQQGGYQQNPYSQSGNPYASPYDEDPYNSPYGNRAYA